MGGKWVRKWWFWKPDGDVVGAGMVDLASDVVKCVAEVGSRSCGGAALQSG